MATGLAIEATGRTRGNTSLDRTQRTSQPAPREAVAAPLIGRTGYAASKHALHGFFGSLRTELAPQGVDVLLVCPSFIATGIERHALAGDGQPARHPQSIVGRRTSAEEVAAQIFDAAAAGKRLLLPGATAKLAYWAWRLAPRFYEWRMGRRLGAELRGE